ncbi:MAG TPA: helix-hairpin-helix domain-containing protein [Tepidisphaeraceae bacterium]|nr:helix-hairpin-helix domain-containing protein [Tepidisphaeraceae bacterium]
MRTDASIHARLLTPSRRGVLAAFVVLLSLTLSVRLLIRSSYIPDPPPARSPKYDELADRLDPNTASAVELSVLPQLGEKRAREIVLYRDQFRADRRGEVAFRTADDLLKVRGIGVAMLATVRPHLMFPATTPTSAPVPAPGTPGER